MNNKLGITFCLIVFFSLIIINSITAECSNDTCPANLTNTIKYNTDIQSPDYTCQDLNCANFIWVETYIKNMSSNLTSDQGNFINLLKTANYGMQDDLNKCNKEIINYKGLSLIIGIAFILCFIYIIIFMFIRK